METYRWVIVITVSFFHAVLMKMLDAIFILNIFMRKIISISSEIFQWAECIWLAVFHLCVEKKKKRMKSTLSTRKSLHVAFWGLRYFLSELLSSSSVVLKLFDASPLKTEECHFATPNMVSHRQNDDFSHQKMIISSPFQAISLDQ